MDLNYLKAEKAALKLIARAEQCSAGLTRKLETRGHSAGCVSRVIESLTEQKLIDDSRYARLWLQSRLRLTRTPRRLLIGLCSRGIPHDEAKAALDSLLDQETEAALLARFAKKQAKRLFKKGENTLSVLKYLLKSEGFSTQAIENFTASS